MPFPAPDLLVALTKPWADFYADSKTAESLVTFAHIGGLLFAGGLAIATDRATLRLSAADTAGRTRQLAELGRAHRSVIGGLVLIVVSGLMLLTADLEAFFGSWVYWTKMGFVVLLLANGYRMTRVEHTLATTPASESGWATLRQCALASLALWFIITLLGVVLVNTA